MGKAVAIFTGGVSELRQIAIREDGTVFMRGQFRHPTYGCRWSKWAATGETLGENARAGVDVISVGFATLRRASPNDCCINNRSLFNSKGEIKVRLP